MREPRGSRTAAAAAALALVAGCAGQRTANDGADGAVQLGPRPAFLVDAMDEGALKDALLACADGPFYRTDFSIGHRGAALQFPEHTRESYVAAARMGAGIVECDVTFTADRELVCRHSQCDLHTTTNILETPLAATCAVPFTPSRIDPGTGRRLPATARCCTSDLTLAEFRSLEGRMDGFDPLATTIGAYLAGTPDWRTDAYAPGTLMSHRESIELFASLGVGMIPELKAPEVEMPFDGGYTRRDYAEQLVADYARAGVPPGDVRPQSFALEDVLYWIEAHPELADRVLYLDGRDAVLDPNDPTTFEPSMTALADAGVRAIGPPIWMLVTERDGAIVPSAYAREARAAGLEIVAWTFERSPPLDRGADYYHQSIAGVVDDDGDRYAVLDVLARDVGVVGVFADWPATTTYYASCMGLPPRRPAGAAAD